MLILLIVLAICAGIGTFIENELGNTKAKELVYTSYWYMLLILLSIVNLILIIYKTKMYKKYITFSFHISLVLIFLGAFLTHFFGIDGLVKIREGEKTNVLLASDNQVLNLPFYIELLDFKITRYPGSKSPSEYSSVVKIIDLDNNTTFQKEISMNNTLVYRGYKFFQTSYDKDEKGTILTVSKDPGVEVTYIAYALLFLGLILNLFDKNSRFQKLIKRVKRMNIASFLLLLMLFAQQNLLANNYLENYLSTHRENSLELSQEFGKLSVQAKKGTMKSLDTFNLEIIKKLTKKSTFLGMNANQIVLGMFTRPMQWEKVEIIIVKTKKLRKILRLKEDQKHARLSDFFFENGGYKLSIFVEKANRLSPSKRGTFHKDVLDVDERVNIALMIFRGKLLKIFPIKNDPQNRWVDFQRMFMEFDDKNLQSNTRRFLDETFNTNYKKALPYLKEISNYQKKFGKNVIPSESKIEAEILYNKLDIFTKLSFAYILVGLILLFYSLSSIFFNKLIHSKIKSLFYVLIVSLFLVQTFGILLRWYISGYIPLSNTYETMVYISYVSILAALLFFRNYTIALSCAVLLSGIFLFGAYLGEANPEITNLVPVLKSFWLSIHVSILTASYGFLGICSMLGFVVLFLFAIRSDSKKYIDTHIKSLTDINELLMILGLVFLIIGNFVGGIWANESWGRYWGWDPKETWTYIAIIVYLIVTHLRLIKRLYSIYLFNLLAMISFSVILMTYYGVNFYLAGLHSYAGGDPVPIPNWVYILLIVYIVPIVISYKKRKL